MAETFLIPLTIGRTNFLSNTLSTDKDLFPGQYPAIEQDIWVPHSHSKVVYQRQDTIVVEITVYNPNPIPTIGELVISNPQFVRDSGPVTNLPAFSEYVTVPAFGTKVVNYSLSGIPNMVTKGHFTAGINIDPDYGMWLESAFDYKIYITESDPNGLQTSPWHEVLEDGCGWADGQNLGQDLVAKDLTFGLNYGYVFYYNGGVDPAYFDEVGQKVIYLLSDLFDDRANSQNPNGAVPGDCRDVSGYLDIVFSALGISGQTTKRFWVAQIPGYFRAMITNPICPIGSDTTQIGLYQPTNWNFHQIVTKGSNSFDSCASLVYDLAGSAYLNPPAGWIMSGWWQTANPNWGGNGAYAFFGLVSGYALFDNSVDPEVFIGAFNPAAIGYTTTQHEIDEIE